MSAPDRTCIIRDALGRLMVPDYEAIVELDKLAARLAEAEAALREAQKTLRGTPCTCWDHQCARCKTLEAQLGPDWRTAALSLGTAAE